MPITNVQMPDLLLTKLETMAKKLDCSMDWLIKDAVSQYVGHIEQEERRLIETREALAEIDSDDVVDGDEVMAWIDSWGTDDEKSAPGV